MAAAKSKKSKDDSRAKRVKGIPKGDAFLPGVTTEDLRKMHAGLSGRKEVRKEALIIAAAIKWREGLGVSEMARQLLSAPFHRKRLAGAAARPRAQGHLGQDRPQPQADTGRGCLHGHRRVAVPRPAGVRL